MKKKILLAIILVIVLIGAGVGYAYYSTDGFKSDKELFMSYLTKSESGEIAENFQKYIDKKENNSYTNKGTATLKVSGDENDESIKMLNDSKLTFEGKTDKKQKLSEQVITADLSMGVNVPVTYKQDGDVYGIQSNLIDRKIIAIRNDDLKSLAKKFDIESEEIPDKIDFEKSKFTKQEISSLKEKYMNIINDNLPEESFNKQKEDKKTVLLLNMTESQLSDISSKILEEIKNDEIILSKIPDGVDVSEIKESIDDLINEMKESTDSSNKAEFKLYVENKKLTKCEIIAYEDEKVTGKIVSEVNGNEVSTKMYDEDKVIADMKIVEKVEENDITYDINMKIYDEADVELGIKVQYKNLLALDNVEEVCSLKISAKNTDELSDLSIPQIEDMTIEFSNTVKFEDTEIEKISDENAIIINDLSDRELQNLFNNLSEKFE